jgi:uncharacterized protein (DUF2267 family)
MKHDEFVTAVEERAAVGSPEEAERTAVVVLQALVDRLPGGEAFDLLAQLPARLKTAVTVTQAPMRMTGEEFVDRIANELGLLEEEARERVRAVFTTIREAVTHGEFRDVLAQLDPEYADLLA